MPEHLRIAAALATACPGSRLRVEPPDGRGFSVAAHPAAADVALCRLRQALAGEGAVPALGRGGEDPAAAVAFEPGPATVELGGGVYRVAGEGGVRVLTVTTLPLGEVEAIVRRALLDRAGPAPLRTRRLVDLAGGAVRLHDDPVGCVVVEVAVSGTDRAVVDAQELLVDVAARCVVAELEADLAGTPR